MVIDLYIHVATIGRYSDILDEISKIVKSSNVLSILDNVFLGIVGQGSVNFNVDHSILYRDSNIANYEFITLNHIKVRSHTTTGKCLYIHTKGVSCTDDVRQAIDDWRNYMLYFLVEKYQTCISILDDSDICGVDWCTEPAPHFSGNFWWANYDYIKRLPSIEEMINTHEVILTPRHQCEFWLGKGNPKVTTLHQSNINVYERHLHKYPRYKYESK